ncbi:arginyl-tRNA synthetase [Podospora didyma]|uniref:arginine--tRNA ligase n=1 Tax=Podospora didyma TaxID=330526 RepID=A0AAE0N7H3_9PEZI|nr:arginyl-tRNA synthetase [Podospora didyma]
MASQSMSIPGASPSTNPLDILRLAIAKELAHATGLDAGFIFASLDRSATIDKGDLILAVPRLRIKGKPPAAQAEKLALQFRTDECPTVKQPVAEGISLQFHANPSELLGDVLPFVLEKGDQYGLDPSIGLREPSASGGERKKIIVEFSSPNIAKEFHVGHLRSTIIGAFISNLYEGAGYDVVRINYLGDWGRQFGLLACGWERYGVQEEFERDPIRHLFKVYVQISGDFKPEEELYKAAKKRGEDTSVLESQGLLGASKAFFKKMEDNEPEAIALWERFRALSVERYKPTYARLNIRFDEYSGESTVKKATMTNALEVLEQRGVAVPDQGALVVDFAKHGPAYKKMDLAILRNRNGTSNYLLRDIGAVIQRHEQYHFDEMIYVVMHEQEAHLRSLFKTLELGGPPYDGISEKLKHISFGKVKGMSTRKGTVVFLDDVINDVSSYMHEQMRSNEAKYAEIPDPARTSELLGISAIMVQDMMGKRANNYEFDLKRMTSFEGDTGPYLQYAHARLCSIARKTGFTREELLKADFSLLTDAPLAVGLVRVIARYPDMVKQTLKTLEPTTILTYLFALAHQLSSSYDVLRVVNAPEGPEVTRVRAALYEAARQTLRNGMVLLGLTPVERM